MAETYQKVARGRGSIGKALQMTEKLGMTRPLIVGSEKLTGILLRKNPALLAAPVFSGYHPNPDFRDAAPGAALFRKQLCNGIISIGGGSAMDTAKAIKAILIAGSPEKALEGIYPDQPGAIPHLAIPGTAGTGAEATSNAVVYVRERKVSLSHPSLLPEGVVLDAALLDTLPEYHKKSAALDALSQGIESYWCAAATEDSRVHAFLAVLGVLDNLKAYLAGDPHAAEEMLDASFQSGKAIRTTRTTAAHAMSYQLTKTMNIAHGHACMLTLPVLWEMAAERDEMKAVLEDLSRKMRLSDPQMVPRLLRGILYDLEMAVPEMPAEETLNELADSVNPERLGNHPVRMTREDVKEAYRRAFAPLCAAEKQACLDIWNYYCA
ncbi:MAG: iron-containing alcohol dehydrogenase [Clostridia bacterium]|nr:iron-containing alcohol dehydrogenase [Clostridia bacterium]